MEIEKDRRMLYNLLLEENLVAFFSAIRSQLHVYKLVDLTHVTRRDLCRIGILSGPDVRRFEKVITRVTKSGGIKGKFTKVGNLNVVVTFAAELIAVIQAISPHFKWIKDIIG